MQQLAAILSSIAMFFSGSHALGAQPALSTFQGGTGTTSPSGILVGDESIRLKTLVVGSNLSFDGTTLSATGGGGGGSGAVATSSAETSSYVPFWTSTAGTPAALSGGDSGFSWNNTAKRLTFTYGSTTAISGTNATFTSLVGALTGNVTGNVSGNAGTVTNGVYTGDAGSVFEVPLSFGNGLTRTTNTVDCDTADASTFGCLTSTDWSTFNGKQAAGNYITALTGDVTASGPGSVSATLATVNGNVGSFTNANITVNGKGLITAASSGSIPASPYEIATTSTISVPDLAYFTKTSGRTTLGSVATTTLAGTGVVSISNSPVVLGASGAVASITGGAGGQLLGWANGIPTWLGTTTAGTGLTYNGGSPGNFSVNTTQNILKISGLTTNGFVQTSGGDGTLSSAALTSGQVTTALGFTPFGGTTPLPIASGGTNATSFTTTGNSIYWNGTRLVTAPAASAVTTPYASTTQVSASSALWISTHRLIDDALGGIAFQPTLGSTVFDMTPTIVNTFQPLSNNGSASVFLGFGTTTPKWEGTFSHATSPQLTLTDTTATAAPFNLRSISGSFYLSTSSPITFATSSESALSITNGFFNIGSFLKLIAYDVANGWNGRITPTRNLSFKLATTTAWTATSTGVYAADFPAPFTGTAKALNCFTDVGSLDVEGTDASTHVYLIGASTTANTNAFTLAFTKGDKLNFIAGNPASSPTYVGCTLSAIETP